MSPRALERFAWSDEDVEVLFDPAAAAPLAKVLAFNPDQARDERGRWTAEGGGASPGGKTDYSAEVQRQERLAKENPSLFAFPSFVMGADHVGRDDLERYVAAYGQEFKIGEPKPTEAEMGKVGQCYMNASQLVMGRDDLDYAEGYAIHPTSMGAILHGWAVDKAGNVLDPTLGHESNKWKYFGVRYPREPYMKWLNKVKYYGVLGSTGKAAQLAMNQGGISPR